MKRLSYPMLVQALCAATIVLSGCSQLSFIKQRLPQPYASNEGSIVFQFEAPSAHVVQLCGNWEENNWCSGLGTTGSFRIGEMSDDDDDGVWKIEVTLEPGRYQYKYKVDEVNWKEDPNNPNRVDDGFGGFNSVLVVD